MGIGKEALEGFYAGREYERLLEIIESSALSIINAEDPDSVRESIGDRLQKNYYSLIELHRKYWASDQFLQIVETHTPLYHKAMVSNIPETGE